ncbi:glycosyltransferase family 4 protein [Flavobacteriaceae bacterium M23B6Z8]
MNVKNDILLISSEFPPQPGGIGNHAYNLAKQLYAQGFKVSVLVDVRSASGEEEARFDQDCGFEVIRVKVTQPRFLMYFTRIQKAFKLAKTHQTLIASGKFPIWLGAFLRFFYPITSLVIIHGSEVNARNKWVGKSINYALKSYYKIVAVSNHTRSLLLKKYQDKCEVIPNGFDPEKFKGTPEKPTSYKGNPTLITVGNVTHRKGQLNVIRHLPGLIATYPKIHYHMVGIPSCEEEFTKEAQKLGVEDYITFHGILSDDALQGCLKESTIFVMLSSETASGSIEGFGIAVLEANYLGVPAIGSKGCGIEDAILEGKSGHLIDYQDTEAFVNAIKNIRTHKEIYQQEAKQWGDQHLWSKIIHEYLKYVVD